MKTLWGLTLAAMVSSSCTLQSLSQTGSGSGTLRMQVSWPQTSQFQLLAIPPKTSTLELTISGSGLGETLTRRFGRETNRLKINLPVGPKSLTLSAFDEQNTLLANASASVRILPQRQVQAVLELESVPAVFPSPDNSSGGGSTPNTPQTPERSPAPEPSGGESGGEAPGQTGGEPNPDTASPTPAPSATPFTSGGSGGGGGGGGGGSGGGGGGGGGGSTVTPEINSLSASPQTLSGLGAATYLKLEATPTSLSSSAFSWNCNEVTAANDEILGDCGDASFSNSASGAAVYWQAPSSESVTPVRGEVRYYRLTATVTAGSRSASEDIVITVPVGLGQTFPFGGLNE
ncbi:MAG: hypothetical protein IGS03_00315 [Candidatus Sericytochromatia bacterium]|nr:hypothetical protein [Candidatus Sericytochromatia bacterium]